VAAADHRARVEAVGRRPGDEGVLGGPRVGGQVRDDEKVNGLDRVGADRAVDRQLALAEAKLRLEPLALGVDEADERDRGPADIGGDPHEIVVERLRLGIEDREVAQLRDPGRGAPAPVGRSGFRERVRCRHIHGPAIT
jgi:hypothetical protein